MTITRYQQETKRTLPDLGTLDKNVQHMDMGIVTEIGEIIDPLKKKHAYGKPVDFVNVGEEIADLSWYISNKNNLHNEVLKDFTLEEALTKHVSDREMFMGYDEEFKLGLTTVWILQIQEYQIYGNGDIEDSQECLEMLCLICHLWGINYFEQLDKNIRKLRARFPDKFDAEKAINRDLEAERKELEN